MPQSSQRLPFLPGLGGLRALAVLAVLTGHAAGLTPLPETPALFSPLARLTQFGLAAFFLLSGFVLQYNYGPALAAGRISLARFALARLARLYPVYLLLLALAVTELAVNEGPAALGNAANIASYLTLTHGWFFSPNATGIFPLSWAISVEAFFYLLFPPIALLLSRIATPRAALGIGLACLAAILGLDALTAASWPQLFPAALARYPLWANTPGTFAGVLFQWLTYTSPYFRAFEFVLGATMARLFVQRPVAWPGLDMLAAAGLITLLIIPFPADNFFLAVLSNNALYAPFLAALCLAWAARPRRWTTHPLLAGIGVASLSIYLVQPWTLPLCKASPGASPPLWAAMALAGMAVTVAAGMALARLVEAPAARYLSGGRKKREGECLRRPGG